MTAPITSLTSATATTSSALTGAVPGGTMGKDDFMKLLITQMTHQDPLSPQDSSQMASQLAQFSALEQMTSINQTLASQSGATSALAGSMNNSAAIALIGKTVMASSDQVAGGTSGTTTIATDIPTGGGHLSVRIVDSNGKTIATKDVGMVTGGRSTAAIGDLTSGLPAGNYTVAFDLADGAGGITHPPSLVSAKIDGVSFGTTGARVTSGSLSIPIGSITSVQ